MLEWWSCLEVYGLVFLSCLALPVPLLTEQADISRRTAQHHALRGGAGPPGVWALDRSWCPYRSFSLAQLG